VADMEQLRALLGIDQWLVFGGSWGSTLALAYAQAHPRRCLALVLRGIFLCTDDEIDWFMHGMGRFFPRDYEEFVAQIPIQERGDLLAAHIRRLFGDDPQTRLHAARAWNRYESSCLHLWPQAPEPHDASSDASALAVARMEAHYFQNRGFFTPDQLLRDAGRLHGIPGIIVQGRYDVICPPVTAQRLHTAWPQARLQIIEDAGHSAFEPGIEAALVQAMDDFRDHGGFARTTAG
jgi:proline iminopeptidase